MTLFGRLAEARSWNPTWQFLDGTIPPPWYTGAVPGLAGGNTTTAAVDDALRLVDAYACISLLEDDVSQLPIQNFRRDDVSRKPIAPPPVLVNPDPEIELWEWIARCVGSLATAGNAYGVLDMRDRNGYPQRCSWVNPSDVRVSRDRNTGLREYKISSPDLGHMTLPATEVLHIPLTVMPGALKGLSPIERAQRSIRLAIATEEFGAQWFDEGATPSSTLEADDEIDEEKALRIQARWIASQGGRRRPAVLSGGLKWKPVQIAPNESQFLETRKLNTEQICAIWRVPPHMIGSISEHASQGGAKGIGAQRMGYVVHTLGPYLTRIERALSSAKISPRGQYAKFKVDALLRGDTAERFAAYAIARQWGWMSVNDIRALEDLPPIDDGDAYLQPLNMVDAQEALTVLLQNDGAAAA